MVDNDHYFTLRGNQIPSWKTNNPWILCNCRLIMPREDREGFIVKFVESKGQKTEYSVKAYEVYITLATV